jgi:hypothetical protein
VSGYLAKGKPDWRHLRLKVRTTSRLWILRSLLRLRGLLGLRPVVLGRLEGRAEERILKKVGKVNPRYSWNVCWLEPGAEASNFPSGLLL